MELNMHKPEQSADISGKIWCKRLLVSGKHYRPASKLKGRLSATRVPPSSSDAAGVRVKLGCREGGSQTSGSSGLAVCDITALSPKVGVWDRILATSSSRPSGDAIGLHVARHTTL